MSSPARLVSRLRGKSLKTLMVRGPQEALLAAMAVTGGWKRLARKTAAHWSPARAQKYLDGNRPLTLFSGNGLAAIARAAREGLLSKEVLLARGADIRARRFSILGAPVPQSGDWPWRTDWRNGHEFPLQDFRRTDHHAPRDIPYDVKYPWELSRLAFLLPLMQKALLEGGTGARAQVEEVFAILSSFEANNPLAQSVNWHPMEVSMRGIALVMLLDMAVLARAPADKIALLLKMIAQHGEFLWRTVEFTDNRGNHYAANITALLVMGAALAGSHGPAMKWQLYATEHIEEEILRQFTPDGVNFEKSLPYHKLVTELFLLAKITLNRQKLALGEEAERRLHEGCLFCATALRPDGLLPVWGDTDDAHLLDLDACDPRDPSALLSLSAVIFADPELKGALGGRGVSAALPWILGEGGIESFIHLPAKAFSGGRHFREGGFMAVRGHGAYVLFDAGEVGQNGLGGHGHNDICSFELGFEGHPFIIDAGCPSYTGDKLSRNLFRSTAWHNAVTLDNAEAADILGPFRIANQALPENVSFGEEEGRYVLQAGHTGYRRLPSPAGYLRRITFAPAARTFTCEDSFTVAGRHRADRHLHFAQGVELSIEGRHVIATLYQHRFKITFDDFSAAEIAAGRVSPGYGQTFEAKVLKLSTEIAADVTLSFSIVKI